MQNIDPTTAPALEAAPALNLDSAKMHPFERAGMDYGPYRFIGVVSIPSPTLAEHNPEAYNLALRMLPRDLVGGCGTCSCCGRAIMNICIIRAGSGRRYGVGVDCVEKTRMPALANKAKVEMAREVRRKRAEVRAAKREAKRQAWLASVDPETGKTHGQLAEEARQARLAAIAAEDAAREAARLAAVEQLAFLLPALDGCAGDFAYSMASDIRSGRAPRGRALAIVLEIDARHNGGRRGSKGFIARWNESAARLGLDPETLEPVEGGEA